MAKPTLEEALAFAIEWLDSYDAESEAEATKDLANGDQNGPQRDLAVAYLQKQLARLRHEAMVRAVVRTHQVPIAVARAMVRAAVRQQAAKG